MQLWYAYRNVWRRDEMRCQTVFREFPTVRVKKTLKKLFFIFLGTSSLLAVSTTRCFLNGLLWFLFGDALWRKSIVFELSLHSLCVCACVFLWRGGRNPLVGIDTYWMVSGMKHVEFVHIARSFFFSSMPLTHKQHDSLWLAVVQWHTSTVTLCLTLTTPSSF